jgi:dihydroorotase
VTIIKPDDWHVHFRDGELMKAVLPETIRHFQRAIVMPNLIPPILSGGDALNYKKKIECLVPEGQSFFPLMTIYLTENTKVDELEKSYINREFFAAKLYPAGATTNSESGVKNISNIFHILERMTKIGIPLLIHGEVTQSNIDIFDREKVFLDKVLTPICQKFPELKITLEHITTKDAVNFINDGNKNIGATITPHHLALNRNAVLVGGIKPHFYCLPILKRETHKQALIKAATSGNKKFFLGTDTAPHTVKNKESNCGCAGIFNATYCISILAEIFFKNNAINNLEKFTSLNGANHYNMKINQDKITIIKRKKAVKFKDYLIYGKQKIVVFKPNFPIFWEVLD